MDYSNLSMHGMVCMVSCERVTPNSPMTIWSYNKENIHIAHFLGQCHDVDVFVPQKFQCDVSFGLWRNHISLGQKNLYCPQERVIFHVIV
jgi:hypothetical protein